MDHRREFVLATFLLAKSNPAVWADFMEAFKMWVAQEIESGLNAPTTEAQVQLGMGRRLRMLRDDFINIEALAAKYQK